MRGFCRSSQDHCFITFDMQQKACETFEYCSSALRSARAGDPKLEFLGGPVPVGWGGPTPAIPDFHRTMHGNVIGTCNPCELLERVPPARDDLFAPEHWASARRATLQALRGTRATEGR